MYFAQIQRLLEVCLSINAICLEMAISIGENTMSDCEHVWRSFFSGNKQSMAPVQSDAIRYNLS
jgi:hypothetical protein